ncbi:MAG: 3'-5' exonuclease, partial [Magnetococcales bacterium]|nr:3'-5' exonuclease [Magnetococcales bacterium]
MDIHRRYWLRRVPPGALRDYLACPFPAAKTPCASIPFLALDLETTGLDAQNHEILTFGFVPLLEGRIALREARHLLVRPHQAIPPETVVLHGLTDDRSATGDSLDSTLPVLLHAMAGRVLLVHYA